MVNILMSEKEEKLINTISSLEEAKRFKEIVDYLIYRLKENDLEKDDSSPILNEFRDLSESLSNLSNLINNAFKKELEI